MRRDAAHAFRADRHNTFACQPSSPFPLQASTSNDQPSTATLTIIATNPNQNPDVDTVALNGIVINIPMGDAGSQLCPTQPNTVVTPAGWIAPTVEYPKGSARLPQPSGNPLI
jgi:hypothetical protein